jgi:hypothetical protein
MEREWEMEIGEYIIQDDLSDPKRTFCGWSIK